MRRLVIGAAMVGALALTGCSTGPELITVKAPDGTVTTNVIHQDGTVTGWVTTPDGETFTFGDTHPVESWDVDTASDHPRIEEDESGWDCTTMGNRICG